MDYRTLGTSGTVVSTFALGTMTFGDEADENASHAIIDAYVAAGGNLLDTADVYTHGVSEEIIGRWFSANAGARDDVVLATKARFTTGEDRNAVGTSRRNLSRALDASLTRLGVEQVDLYQMHAWDPLTPIEETLGFLADAVVSGKIVYYGFSNFTGWQLTKAVAVADRHGWPRPVTLQPQYSLLVRGIEAEIVPAAQDAGAGLLPWSPLASGWLTGKYERDVPPSAGRLKDSDRLGDAIWSEFNDDDRTWDVLDVVRQIAADHDASAAQVALAWLEQQAAVTSVILGARNTDQLADNLAAADVALSPDEVQRLTDVSAPQQPNYPYGAFGTAQRGRKI